MLVDPMKPAPFLFGTNVKMHQTAVETLAFVRGIQSHLEPAPGSQVFVIPPFTSLAGVTEAAHETGYMIGGQTMHFADEGAYTGEISARMLAGLGVDLVMLGHAERRTLFGETDAALQKKVQAALRAGLRVLLCVGENADEKHYGVEAETISRQLRIALHEFNPADLPRLWVAYEPVWSIGESGRPAPVADVRASVAVIRATLVALFDDAAGVPVLYGGSVNRSNCAAYAEIDLIDGLFVGRAAWTVEGFVDVYAAARAASARRPELG